MMLIYPKHQELDCIENRPPVGLASGPNPKIYKIGSSKCHEERIDSVEEMLREEGNKSPDVVFTLPLTLRVWKYNDFDFLQIGEGFFGNVYKVTHKTTGIILVLKELKSAADEEHRAMFIEEIKTLHRLCHPNILKCEGMALNDESPCLLTEFITGGSLDEMLTKRSVLLGSWEARLSVALEIARGMHYLHSEGVIHRDLASKNILLRKKDSGELQAIVADLGLCHTIQGLALSEEVYELDTVGSPYHMAPEVLNHKPYNMKADVFSYGIILCEIITMCPGADPDDVPRSHDFGLAVEDFSEMASDCPSSLLDLTIRCCQFNPRERPSFDNIVKALDIMLDHFFSSDDDILNENGTVQDQSLFLDHSLICTCGSLHNGNFLEADTDNAADLELGVEVFKDRFGSVRKRASRRVLKSKLRRCSKCGGRVWRNHNDLKENEQANGKSDYRDNDNLDRSKTNGSMSEDPDDTCITPPRRSQAIPIPRREFSAGALLKESQDTIYLSKLVDNTPGKLPKFFRNLLGHRRGKRGNKETKRNWRKSIHEIFSSHSHHSESSQKMGADTDSECNSRIGSPTFFSEERGVSPTKDHKFDFTERNDVCEKHEKHEKQRKPSIFRRKSEHKSQMGTEKVVDVSVDDKDSSGTVFRCDGSVLQNSSGTNAASCGTTDSRKTSRGALRQIDKMLTKKLAASVDSLDKLAIRDEKETTQRRRRYSMPYRKSRHSRTQSVENQRPTLQKKTSSSSKILNFLRKKSLSSARDKES